MELFEQGLTSRHPHVTAVLAGRFKNEVGEKVHYLPLAPITKSGIKILRWVRRLLWLLEQGGVTTGPLLRDDMGKRATVRSMDKDFHKLIRRAMARDATLVPEGVNVEEEYSVRRSLRRGSNTEAQNVRIPVSVIERNNRWRKVERAKGKTPSFNMVESYSDARLMAKALSEYSSLL